MGGTVTIDLISMVDNRGGNASVSLGVRIVVQRLPAAEERVGEGGVSEFVLAEIGCRRHGRMECHQPAALIDENVQHGRIAESGEYLWIVPYDVIIEQIRKPCAAVAAANHYDGTNLRVSEGAVDVGGAKTVASGEESAVSGAGGEYFGFQSKPRDKSGGEVEAFGQHRHAGRYQRDLVAFAHRLRKGHFLHRESSTFM